MEDILRLPQEYITGRDGNIALTSSDLGRLSIAGLLDLGAVWQNADFPWPAPLLLLDGEPTQEDQATKDGKRRFFYGPRNVHSGEDPANPPVELSNTEWAFHVNIPDDPQKAPSSYLGHGIYPDGAIAIIFSEPLPYRQEVFEEAARTWLQELGLLLD